MKVNGIILVLSCQKHKTTRLKQFKLPQDNYGDWKVIYVIGDLFLDTEYTLHENILTIRCEDSYIHLLKKLVLALKYVYELYDIQEGVLRCGDDLIFNEQLLQLFLNSPKYDFMGKSPSGKSLLNKDITPELLKRTRHDTFMVNYYKTHLDNFVLKQNIVQGTYIKVPKTAPRIQRIKPLVFSNKPKEMEELKSYCLSFSAEYQLPDSSWIELDKLVANSPMATIPDKIQFLRNYRYYETNDQDFLYFLKVDAFKIVDNVSPVELVESEIKNIILNKRKVELAKKLEDEVYENGAKRKEFEVFNP